MDQALTRYNRERLPDVKALLALNRLWAARWGVRAEVGPEVQESRALSELQRCEGFKRLMRVAGESIGDPAQSQQQAHSAVTVQVSACARA